MVPTVPALGVGVDLVEVPRVSAIIADKGARVFERLLTPAERAYCESRPDVATHVAVRLAAKEAVYKALQGSDAARGIGWREIEVIRPPVRGRSEEHTSELQSPCNIVCRLLLEKKKKSSEKATGTLKR